MKTTPSALKQLATLTESLSDPSSIFTGCLNEMNFDSPVTVNNNNNGPFHISINFASTGERQFVIKFGTEHIFLPVTEKRYAGSDIVKGKSMSFEEFVHWLIGNQDNW